MTDHQKLLVTLLSEPVNEADHPQFDAALTAILYELGADHRALEAVRAERIPV